MQVELDTLLSNNTWELVEVSTAKTTIGCKWVFKVKLKPDKTLDKYKIMSAAKGFL